MRVSAPIRIEVTLADGSHLVLSDPHACAEWMRAIEALPRRDTLVVVPPPPPTFEFADRVRVKATGRLAIIDGGGEDQNVGWYHVIYRGTRGEESDWFNASDLELCEDQS